MIQQIFEKKSTLAFALAISHISSEE